MRQRHPIAMFALPRRCSLPAAHPDFEPTVPMAPPGVCTQECSQVRQCTCRQVQQPANSMAGRVPSRRMSRIAPPAGRDEMARRLVWRTYALTLAVVALSVWSIWP